MFTGPILGLPVFYRPRPPRFPTVNQTIDQTANVQNQGNGNVTVDQSAQNNFGGWGW